MEHYQLHKDGDPYERRYYTAFIRDEFHSYEIFWQTHPPPKRHGDIDFSYHVWFRMH
jgi:hypothetical protein